MIAGQCRPRAGVEDVSGKTMTRFGRTLPTSARKSPARPLPLIVVAAAVILNACSGSPHRPVTRSPAQPVVPTPVGVSGVSFDADRIYVFPGRTAVFPLTPPEEARSAGLNWRPNHLPKVVLEGGREVIPRVYRLTGSPEGSGPDRPSAKNDSWLGPRVIWTVELFNPASPPPPVAAGTVIGPVWLAAMDMPTDIDPRELPRFVRIDGSAAPVTWMARPPSAIDTAMLPEFDKTPGMGPGPGAIAALGEIIRPLASDPTERWRARMLTERFGARPLWGDATPPDLARALPEPLEQSATQLETCIRVALDNLRRIDRPLAAQVQNRLLHIVRAPTGVLLPAWPPTDADLTELMTRLLDPRPLRAERVDAAHAWLAKLPTIQAWVIDDLGAPSSPAGSEPTIGVADLSGNGGGVSLYTDVGNPIPLLSLTPGGSTAARVSVPLTGPGRTLHAQCMPSPTIDLHLFGGLLPAKPPGAELGPLVQAWNHQTWSKRLVVGMVSIFRRITFLIVVGVLGVVSVVRVLCIFRRNTFLGIFGLDLLDLFFAHAVPLITNRKLISIFSFCGFDNNR